MRNMFPVLNLAQQNLKQTCCTMKMYGTLNETGNETGHIDWPVGPTYLPGEVS